MAPTFAHRSCLHHAMREAVARCPECREFFCRECITEHDNRVVCSGCLKRSAQAVKKVQPRTAWWRPLYPLVGLLVAWLFFYHVGRVLVSIPATVHDGSFKGQEDSE